MSNERSRRRVDDRDLVLELRGVSRQFGAVRALTDVSFDCRAGEVHALVGENGSGKSTLLGIASGFVDPDLGTVRIGGQPLRRDSPALGPEARVWPWPTRTPRWSWPSRSRTTSTWRRRRISGRRSGGGSGGRGASWREFDLDLELFPDAPAGFLTLAERQLFEVAKALVSDPKVLLLDEPTTALGPDEVEALHRTVAACRARGVGVVYVSHRLPEVLEIADRITVLRDGRNQGTFDARATSEAELVDLIVGPPLRGGVPAAVARDRGGREVLVVDGLQGQSFGPVSFTLRAGRSSAIAGAEGNGQPQLFDCLAGPPAAGRDGSFATERS